MKKKLFSALSLLLIVCLMLALAGCGSSSDTASNDSESSQAAAAEEESADTQEETAGEADETEQSDGTVYEELSLTATTSFSTTEDGGKNFQYFCDYIEEHSNGAITIELYTGGTLCSSSEELNMVASGAVDMAALATTQFLDTLTLLNFPTMVLGDEQTALDYYNYLTFENEETAALIADEAAANNVKYLGFQAGGTTCWLSTKTLTCIDDIKGIKFGAAQNQNAFLSLGVDVVSLSLPDGYENLSRGVLDAVTMSFNPTVAMKWYEVATNYLMLGTYVAGNPFTINLDVWNAMPESTQALFEEAAKATAAYSLELARDGYETNMNTVLDAGCTVSYISEEEGELWYSTMYKYQVIDCRSVAESAGKADEMETVLAAAAEYVGIDLSAIETE
ncbi:MAG: TRAP transporter substrate-binding protein DctP [Oscillospiraceae bacterium]|nr:TRAP transporter substrate-binding protein DctP [Oscillospiraceae bacterium]